MSDASERRIDREMLHSMEMSFRSGLGFSFNPHDMADLMRRMEEMVDPKPRAAPTADLPPTLAEALVEALTPSGDTKAAYIGEIKDPETTRMVSWTAIKMVMKMVSDRAALRAVESA